MGASNPRWSFDDRYLAVNILDLNVGTDMLIFDSRIGASVLKVNGTSTCFGDYWVPGESAVKGQFEAKNKVLVPSGALAPLSKFDTGWNFSDGRSLDLRPNSTALVKDGQDLAEVVGGASVPSLPDQFDIFRSDGRATVLVGLGGKGLCGEGTTPPFEVQKPPFPD